MVNRSSSAFANEVKPDSSYMYSIYNWNASFNYDSMLNAPCGIGLLTILLPHSIVDIADTYTQRYDFRATTFYKSGIEIVWLAESLH